MNNMRSFMLHILFGCSFVFLPIVLTAASTNGIDEQKLAETCSLGERGVLSRMFLVIPQDLQDALKKGREEVFNANPQGVVILEKAKKGEISREDCFKELLEITKAQASMCTVEFQTFQLHTFSKVLAEVVYLRAGNHFVGNLQKYIVWVNAGLEGNDNKRNALMEPVFALLSQAVLAYLTIEDPLQLAQILLFMNYRINEAVLLIVGFINETEL